MQQGRQLAKGGAVWVVQRKVAGPAHLRNGEGVEVDGGPQCSSKQTGALSCNKASGPGTCAAAGFMLRGQVLSSAVSSWQDRRFSTASW
jgi:hypothetical protein